MTEWEEGTRGDIIDIVDGIWNHEIDQQHAEDIILKWTKQELKEHGDVILKIMYVCCSDGQREFLKKLGNLELSKGI
jgi:hypothetical protein